MLERCLPIVVSAQARLEDVQPFKHQQENRQANGERYDDPLNHFCTVLRCGGIAGMTSRSMARQPLAAFYTLFGSHLFGPPWRSWFANQFGQRHHAVSCNLCKCGVTAAGFCPCIHDRCGNGPRLMSRNFYEERRRPPFYREDFAIFLVFTRTEDAFVRGRPR